MRGKNLIFFIAGLFLIVSLLFVSFVSADFSIGTPTHNIETTYEPGDKVTGYISIQLTNESNSTLFEDSEANSMTLLELITENPSFSYSVNSTYGTLDTTSAQNLNLDEGVFNLPNTIGNISYQFNFSGEEIFIEELTIALAVEDLNSTLNNKLEDFNNLKAEINTYDVFEQTSLNSALKITYIESQLANLSLDYLSATTQAELDSISANLSLIEIPSRIEVPQTAISIPIFPKSENINLNDLEAISNSTSNSTYEVGEESKYKTAIIGWNVNNLNIKVSFKEFVGVYGTSKEVIVRTFDLEISKREIIDYPIYIFIKNLNDTLFKQDYQKQEQGNYYVFSLTNNSETISFSTTENVNFTNLDFFISPAFTELGVEDFEYIEGEEEEENRYEQRKWTIFTLVIILVLILGFILYLVLSTWYKKRYEAYLFKSKTDLYNLANYITNSKKRGLDNNQIKENLKKSKWTSEQIRYALKKYSGKRTGMYEIVLKKTLEKNNHSPSSKDRYGRYPKE